MSLHPPRVGVHTPIGAELVVFDNKLPWISEDSELIVSSFTASLFLPESELVVSSYNIPTYISLELTERFMTPIQETIFKTGELVIGKV